MIMLIMFYCVWTLEHPILNQYYSPLYVCREVPVISIKILALRPPNKRLT